MSLVRILHHFPLDPASRQARLALGEKRLPFQPAVVHYWEQRPGFMALNPSGMTPVLEETGGGKRVVVCEIRAILEHLEEVAPGLDLLGAEPAERAEVRRLQQWFDRKFDTEVNACLLFEKLEKRLQRLGAPDLQTIRDGRDALRFHLTYLEKLLEARDWLAGRNLSLADIAAAAHISVIDYFGDVPWRDFKLVTTWYMRIKSRPAFRPILADRWPGFAPSGGYDNLDFG